MKQEFHEGQEIGRWRVVCPVPIRGQLLVACSCGRTERFVPVGNLRAGISRGCLLCRRTRGPSRVPSPSQRPDAVERYADQSHPVCAVCLRHTHPMDWVERGVCRPCDRRGYVDAEHRRCAKCMLTLDLHDFYPQGNRCKRCVSKASVASHVALLDSRAQDRVSGSGLPDNS